jgi:hypothetical protein
MSNSFLVRTSAAAGWAALAGIVSLFIAFPIVIAGPPPTATTASDAVIAYFRHPEFALMNGYLGVFFGAVATTLFLVGLRAVLRDRGDERGRAFADFGLAIAIVALPVYTVCSALGAALVQAADGDPQTFAVLFRIYDVMYNGAADVLEGAWIMAFSIAAFGATPRWIGWLGITVAATRWIKASIPFGVPVEMIGLVGGILFIVWFVAVAVLVTRAAINSSPAVLARPVNA